MNQKSNAVQFLRIITAFQHFAGKSLKVTDLANGTPPQLLNQIEEFLYGIAREARLLNQSEWPDLHRLANQIENSLKGLPTHVQTVPRV